MNKNRILLLLSFLLLSAAFFPNLISASAEEKAASKIGIYHWDGAYLKKSGDPLIEGAEHVKQDGARIINIVVYPYWDYRNGEKFEPSSLTLRARRDDYQKVLSDPSFETIVVTAFDWASYPMRFAALPANYERKLILNNVSAEISDFVLYLAVICNGQKKTFVIKDWEVENRLGIKTDRLDQPGVSTERWRDYLDYIVARQRGVDDGAARARSLGLSSVKFLNAVETVNIYALLIPELKENSVLWQMKEKGIKTDLVSLSAWQPIYGENGFRIYLGLKYGIGVVSDFVKTNKIAGGLFVGEFGILPGFDPQLLRYAIDAINESDAIFGVKWNLYNVGTGWLEQFGDYDGNGNVTPQGIFMRKFFAGEIPNINPGGVVDAFTRENKTWSGIVEIYGANFAERPKVEVAADSDTEKFYAAEILYVSDRQANVVIPRLPELVGRKVFIRVGNSNFQSIFLEK